MAQTYSFGDVAAAISGPGGAISIGTGAAAAEEGITAAFTAEKDILTTGADGEAMHSLRLTKAGRITVRLLKTSPVNALLMAMYNFQTASAATHGQGTIVVSDIARGDVITGQEAAFARGPSVSYAVEGGMIEWEFNVGKLDMLLGEGAPSLF